jgi:VWFA-related protein
VKTQLVPGIPPSFPLRTTLAAALLSLSLPLAAQQAAAQQPAAPAAKHPILLDVLVTNKSNKPVPNLQQQDFTVLDNGQPSKVLVFHQHNLADVPANEVDASTSVIIVLDEVNAPFDRVTFARQGIQEFLKQNNGNLSHPVSLAFFTEHGLDIQTSPSIDGNALSAAIDKQVQSLRMLDEGTGFRGAQERTLLSLNALNSLLTQEQTKPGRKMVLWVGPGWPLLTNIQDTVTASQQQDILHSVVRVSTDLRQARITLYSIDTLGTAGVGTNAARYYETYAKPLTKPSDAYRADLSLQVLATQTGGRVLFGNDLIQTSLNNCVADLNAFYTLLIDGATSPQPDTFHSLDVKLSPPNLKVRTRNGYYAQP